MGITHILWAIIVGFVVGLIARAILPGAQHLGAIATIVLGILGSIAGGVLGSVISRPKKGSMFHPAGFVLSIIGALLLLFLWIRLA